MPRKALLFLFVGPTSLPEDVGSTEPRLVLLKFDERIVFCGTAVVVATVAVGAAAATSVRIGEASRAVEARRAPTRVRPDRRRACVIRASAFQRVPRAGGWAGAKDGEVLRSGRGPDGFPPSSDPTARCSRRTSPVLGQNY